MDLNARLESHEGADTQVAVIAAYVEREQQLQAWAMGALAEGCIDEWAVGIGLVNLIAVARRSEAAEHPGWSGTEEVGWE